MSKILNPRLYAKAKAITKRRYANSWPSAYASGALVTLYKKMGGRYSGAKTKSGIDRWFKEKWINVCKWPKKVPCGRPKRGKSPFPYCRPSIKVSKKTPVTVQNLSPARRARLCSKKRRNPKKRMKSLSRKKSKRSRSKSRSKSKRKK